jgi:hypothetical protein
MSYGIGKRTWEPLQISINRGPQPKERRSLKIQIFFKTSSSSKEALSKVLKPPSSTLEVYKERSSVGSSLNAPLEFFNNTLKTNQRYSSKHQITRVAVRYKFPSRQALQARKISLSLSLSLSSSKEAVSKSSQASFIYAWSLQRTKVYWIKPKRPIRVLQQHFEDTSKVLFKASNHQVSLSSVGSKLNTT